MYKFKFHSNGTLESYKSRFVAKGYTQQEGTNFEETFSPVAKMITVRMILALDVANSWDIFQMDVNNSFL